MLTERRALVNIHQMGCSSPPGGQFHVEYHPHIAARPARVRGFAPFLFPVVRGKNGLRSKPEWEAISCMEPTMAEINFRNVSKRYGDTVALVDASFAVEDNEFFCFFGPPPV